MTIWKWKKNEGNYYEELFRKLDKNKIDYLLIGGVAVALYGIPRVTGDVDFILNMDSDNILKFIKCMKELGYSPKVPVNPKDLADPQKRKDWQDQKNMKVFSFQHPDNPFVLIDIMIDNPLDYNAVVKDKKTIEYHNTKVFLIPKKALIKLKEMAGREQDISDIKALLESGEN